MKQQFVRIVPRVKDFGGLVPTMGTKVMVGDQELPGVTKIVLIAEVGGIWRAQIHCHVNMQPMDALAVIHYPLPWWRRVLNWINGDTTPQQQLDQSIN